VIQARAVIFDFDLTLADSSAAFEACHTYAAQHLGLTPPADDAVRRSIGTPLPLAVPMLYGNTIDGRVDEYISLYQPYADEVMGPMTVMLPGAVDIVRHLDDASVQLAIVSQKLRYRVEEVLQREGLFGCFAVVLGGEDVPAFKPDPSGLQLALGKLGVSASDAIYVGDTTIDAQAAANAGLRFIAVLTGPTTAEEFAPYAVVAILDSVAALPELLGLR
jgi:phosphoglycolate phosphatase